MKRAGALVFAFLVLVASLQVGTGTAVYFDLPIPGAVLGLLLLLVLISVIGSVPEPLERVSTFLLSHMNLFFVPAGVGLMGYAALVARDWLPIAVALVVSTFAGLAVAALVFKLFAKEGADE